MAAIMGVDSSIDTTSENLIKNKIITANISAAICFAEPDTQAKTAPVVGFTLFPGAIVRVQFVKGSSVENPTLNINNTGAKPIKVFRDGIKIALPTHKKLNKGQGGTPTYTTVSVDAGIIIELFYDGTDWVVMGNPDVMTHVEENESYIVKANGLIIQMMQQVFSPGKYYSFPLAFSTAVFLTGTAQTKNSHSVVFKYDGLTLSGFKYFGAWSNESQSALWTGVCFVVAIGF